MLERIGHLGRRPVAEDQSRGYQLGERVLQRDAPNWRYLLQKVKGKLPADRRADLRDLLDRSQTIEPRHQGVLQGRGNCERRKHGGEHVGPVLFTQQLGLQHGLCQFLYKKRHAVGLGDDLLQNLRRQRLATGDPINQWQGHGAARTGSTPTTGRALGLAQGGTNSGRNVTMRNARSSGIRSTRRLNNSSDDGSAQCASSSNASTGASLVNP